LIVLGGHVLPIVATLLFLGFLIVVASISYYLIEKPGQELFARLAGGLRTGSTRGGDRSPGAVRSVGIVRSR
jgi:peptidoglycan/LPS O-acetylase OafA/YrhL